LKKFVQIDEFWPELLSALEHDIASIYLKSLDHSTNHFIVVFKRTYMKPWMDMLPPFRDDEIIAQGNLKLKKYIENLGLTDFGLGKLGLE
jgi:hypothetical protein